MEKVKQYNKTVTINGISFNDNDFVLIAGPCAIESKEQMEKVASFLEKNNIHFMRAFPRKPRTSPYTFQGLGEKGLEIIKEIKEKHKINIVSEIIDEADLDFYREYVDVIQVGTRNMQNFMLLEHLGSVNKPVILKRGFGNTISEWLYAAEYLLTSGCENVILCERGIKTFETATRNTLDISSIPLVKEITKLPIIADPSHASGKSELIAPLSKAIAAVGANGLMIEIHECPNKSLSDSDQALSFEEAQKLFDELKTICKALNKKIN